MRLWGWVEMEEMAKVRERKVGSKIFPRSEVLGDGSTRQGVAAIEGRLFRAVLED